MFSTFLFVIFVDMATCSSWSHHIRLRCQVLTTPPFLLHLPRRHVRKPEVLPHRCLLWKIQWMFSSKNKMAASTARKTINCENRPAPMFNCLSVFLSHCTFFQWHMSTWSDGQMLSLRPARGTMPWRFWVIKIPKFKCIRNFSFFSHLMRHTYRKQTRLSSSCRFTHTYESWQVEQTS